MRKIVVYFLFLGVIIGSYDGLEAQNIYELRKLTEDEWLSMKTDERMRALNSAYRHTENQTFLGDFGRYYDLYKRWGYEFYEMEDRYENYAFREYDAYNLIEERRRRWSYNEFGDRIQRMRVSQTIWNETYYGDNTMSLRPPTGYINNIASSRVDGIWVARESTNDWAVSVIGAGAIRKKFTPLTLNLPNIDGIAIDLQSANTSASVLSSSLLHMYNVWGSGERDYEKSDLVQYGGVILRGGRVRRKFGVLTLGATYVNQYSVQGNREKGSRWFGTVSNFTPTPLYVAIRFMDDSPDDNEGGPLIYDIRLKVNGKYRDDIKPQIIKDDVRRDRVTAVVSPMYKYYTTPASEAIFNGPDLDNLSFENLPKHIDYRLYNEVVQGNNLDRTTADFDLQLANSYYQQIEQGFRPIQVNGTEVAVYLFDLAAVTEKLNRVEAVITVANDYRIQTSQIFTRRTEAGHDTSGDLGWYNTLYWKTTAQAEGNIKDGSNFRTIKVDFGYQVASLNYGFDADFNYRGFKIKGEFVTNSNHYMFPDGAAGTGDPPHIVHGLAPRTGHRWTVRDNAYYIITQKDWDKFGFAGELFKMGKFYRPWLDYYNTTIHKRYAFSVGTLSPRNRAIRIPLIEDNDDEDASPDSDYVRRHIGVNIYGYEDPDGVFPGNDEDHDGIPDNNKNMNDIPDYFEPFLMFDSVPDEFIFGDDYNNNNIPDFREDDMKLDTPYDLDRRGHHFFFRYTPIRNLNLFLGSFRTTGDGLDYRTNDDYFKAQLNYDVFDVGKLYAEYRHERIKDNIRDPFIRVEIRQWNWILTQTAGTKNRYPRALYYDELEYRNSTVNRLFLDSRIRAIPSITLENSVRFENNNQIEGSMYDKVYQPEDTLNTLAMVNKTIYTKSWGNLVFSPGIHFRLYKKARSESIQPLDHYLMRIPLVMFKYVISPQTDIMLGLQGIPGLEFQYKDYIQDNNDYSRKTYTLQLENRTTYFGYQIWASVGLKFDEFDYETEYRSFEDYKSSSTFVMVNLGW